MTKKKEDLIVWEGIEALRQFLRPIGTFKLDPKNARTHSDRNIATMRSSLREFGQHRLAVERADGTLQLGHAMILAAQELGWTHIAGINSGDEGVRARLRALVDNRVGDPEVGSSWDFPNLADDLADLDCGLFDLEDFGFSEEEREQIATWDGQGIQPTGEAPPGLDTKKPITCPNCGHEWVKE